MIGSDFTLVGCIQAVASRFSSLFRFQMQKDVRKSRFEAAAAALRENLKRRKAQSRGRSEQGSAAGPNIAARAGGHENATAPRDTRE